MLLSLALTDIQVFTAAGVAPGKLPVPMVAFPEPVELVEKPGLIKTGVVMV